jgi:SAM-dependent methyltransferase
MPEAFPAFPIRLPDGARRPFADSHLAHRLVQVAQLPEEGRVLGLGGGSSSLALTLAKDFRIPAILGVLDDEALGRERARVREAGIQDRVEVRTVDPARLPFRDGEFHVAIVESHLWMPPERLVRALRRHLVPSEGRLAFTWPVRVGREGPEDDEPWAAGIGEPLRLPRELLQLLSGEGFEPEDALTLDGAQLDALYRDWEQLPRDGAGQLFREEALRHRARGGGGTSTWALSIGRRREPNERPYQSQDRG